MEKIILNLIDRIEALARGDQTKFITLANIKQEVINMTILSQVPTLPQNATEHQLLIAVKNQAEYNNNLHKEIKTLNQRIKELEKEAESYRNFYNELKNVILEYIVNPEYISHTSLIGFIRSEFKKIDELQNMVDNTYEQKEYFRKKLGRLEDRIRREIALRKKNDLRYHEIKYVLDEYQAAEKKRRI